MKYLPILAAILLTACGNGSPPAPAATTAKASVAAPSKTPMLGDKPGSALVNPDFEQTATDGSIPGWTGSQHAGPQSFTMRIDSAGAYAGHGSFHITRTHPQVYGSLSQIVDARSYAGKTVELSAMLKTQGVGPKGWVLFINAGMPGTVRNSVELTGDRDWQKVSVLLPVPPDARWLTVGATLRDAGDGWMDDVALKVVD